MLHPQKLPSYYLVMALMNYFCSVMKRLKIAKNHWLWNYPFYLRYFVRGLDRLLLNDKYINECILASCPGDSHFGLHSKQTEDFYDHLVPGLKNILLPENYNIYKYYNPETKNELLHLIRKAEFYGMLQKLLQNWIGPQWQIV